MLAVGRNQVCELTFITRVSCSDPFNSIDLDVVFTGPDKIKISIPGFWAGDNVWKVRFSSPVTGRFEFQTVCESPGNDLHNRTGYLDVIEYNGDNILFNKGSIRVSDNKRYMTYGDGSPFFWLADTWWMGLTARLSWPKGFQMLTNDRVEKGFSVIQIVAGLYPDMPAFDERGLNEYGFPWQEDFLSINPEYFNYADRRIAYLVDMGLMPCIVGCWGYYLRLLGIEKMKKHWRYLIARWGAYPVVWCLAGEAKMPYYMSKDKEADVEFQCEGWSELAEFVRDNDPFHRLISIHPTDSARNQVKDPTVLDFDMLQTGHGDRASLPNTVQTVCNSYSQKPAMPVINSEVCYEGIGESCRQEVQRLMFWTCILSGSCGHTYGANGIWQINTREKPYGPSPHGMAWGNTPWEDAYKLPGSGQLGIAKKILEKYEWWNMQPHPEWIDRHWTEQNYTGAYAAGIPDKLRIVYFPLCWWGTGIIREMEPGITYNARLFNPVNGEETVLGIAEADSNGDWEIPLGSDPWRVMPIYQDWILVLQAQ